MNTVNKYNRSKVTIHRRRCSDNVWLCTSPTSIIFRQIRVSHLVPDRRRRRRNNNKDPRFLLNLFHSLLVELLIRVLVQTLYAYSHSLPPSASEKSTDHLQILIITQTKETGNITTSWSTVYKLFFMSNLGIWVHNLTSASPAVSSAFRYSYTPHCLSVGLIINISTAAEFRLVLIRNKL